MAANTLASIAAATAAGYKLERVTLPNGRFITKLGKHVVGVTGQSGRYAEFVGDGATSGAADTAALANLNKWRDNRYGSDSAAVSKSSTPSPAASPSTQGTSPSHSSLTKDRD